VICYRARWVLPISARPLEDGVVAVDNGRIRYVGPRNGAPAGDTRDLGEAVLMPGLVNAHTHLELTALRGFIENLDFARWITRLQAVKKAVFDREQYLDAARLGLAEGLRAGVTTYADTCDSGVAFDAMLEAGVRGIMYQEVFGPDPKVAESALSELSAKIDALQTRQTPLVRVGVSPHAPFTVSDALFKKVAGYAAKHALPMAVHIAESEAERQLVEEGSGVFADALRRRGIVVQTRGRSSIEVLSRTGVLDGRPLLIHCVRVDATDIEAIAASESTVAHCPISNAKLGHGIAPVAALLDAGVAVGLGSDSMASNNQMDLLAESRAALLAQGTRSSRHDTLTAGAALRLATLGGARALGLDDEIGSLEVGKAADIVAFPILAERGPMHDPVAAAVLTLPGTPASLVVVAGRELVRDSRLLSWDADLPARVERTAARMRAWALAE